MEGFFHIICLLTFPHTCLFLLGIAGIYLHWTQISQGLNHSSLYLNSWFPVLLTILLVWLVFHKLNLYWGKFSIISFTIKIQFYAYYSITYHKLLFLSYPPTVLTKQETFWKIPYALSSILYLFLFPGIDY